jgi:hypothetical protein
MKLAHVQKGSKRVCMSTVVVCPDPFSPLPLTSLAVKTPEKNRERTLMTLNQQMKEILQWSTPVISCIAQVLEQ